MVRHQMLCIVTPGWRWGDQRLLRVRPLLDRALDALGRVHFASVALLPPMSDQRGGHNDPPSLMLELAVDDGLTPRDLITWMVQRQFKLLWAIYGAYWRYHGRDGLDPSPQSRQAWLIDYLLRHASQADGGFVGARDRTVWQIQREDALFRRTRQQLGQILASPDGMADRAQLASQLRQWAWSQADLAWARQPAPTSFWREGQAGRTLFWVGLIGLAVLGLVLAVIAACTLWRGWQEGAGLWGAAWPLRALAAAQIAAAIYLLLVAGLLYLIAPLLIPPWGRARHRPTAATSHTALAPLQVHPTIEQCEAHLARRVGHMISLTELRRPWLHRPQLWLRLRIIAWLGHIYFTESILGNAPGIRFGHWHLIDDGRRLLFCSNFDGTFGGYLDDFILSAAEGVNLCWGLTEILPRRAAISGHPAIARAQRFPPTRVWMYAGCHNELAFKSYARDSMVPHLHRYEAYRLTWQDVNRATRLRNALFATPSPVHDEALLRALDA